jgi:drug/metabolite transporter superfamily protein YnfA
LNRLLAALAPGVLSFTSFAQEPDTLKYSIPSPSTALQTSAQSGWAVAVDGNLIVVGAPLDDVGGVDAGVVNVFDADTGARLHTIANPGQGERFGASVAISGSRVVIGAPDSFHGGSAYVYDLSSPAPTVPVAVLDNPDPLWTSSFGAAVAISGTKIVVGVPQGWFGGPTEVGTAYLFDLAGATPTTPALQLTPGSYSRTCYFFGTSVAISGDYVLVGATGRALNMTSNWGCVYLYKLTDSVPDWPIDTIANPLGSPDSQFGCSLAASGNKAVVGASSATIRGAGYVFQFGPGYNPNTSIKALNRPTWVAGDGFGCSVAISGDLVVIGAYLSDGAAADTGRAYVYDTFMMKPRPPLYVIENPTPAASDYFGYAVAMSGSRVVIGSPRDDDYAFDAGVAHVYNLASITPTTPVAALTNATPPSLEAFGGAVALSGSILVAGAPGDDTSGDNSGSAYVYDLSSATPAAPAFAINNPRQAANEQFGYAVAVSGTLVAIGAPTAVDDRGRVYVYDLASATPLTSFKIIECPGVASGRKFGAAVAMNGQRVVVGAPGPNPLGGEVFVYDLSISTPTDPIFILSQPSDVFGQSVAISGDLVIVGSPRELIGTEYAGSAFVYDLSSATPLTPAFTLNNPAPVQDDAFGNAVAIAGTLAVVGAPADDAGATDAGSAYVYDLSSATPTAPFVTLANPTPMTNDAFGKSVSISGARVVVSAPRDNFGAFGAGNAYIYNVAGTSPDVPTATIHKPAPVLGDNFGDAAAVDGNTIAVGAPLDDGNTSDRGAVYVFGLPPLDADSDGLLDSWEIAHWGTIVGHSALDDFDGDGCRELLEQAFMLDPKLPDAGDAPTPIVEEGYLTISITRQPGVIYTVQSAGTPEDTAFSSATTTVLVDNATTLKVRDNEPIAASTGRFMRVKVSAAP